MSSVLGSLQAPRSSPMPKLKADPALTKPGGAGGAKVSTGQLGGGGGEGEEKGRSVVRHRCADDLAKESELHALLGAGSYKFEQVWSLGLRFGDCRGSTEQNEIKRLRLEVHGSMEESRAHAWKHDPDEQNAHACHEQEKAFCDW